MRFHILGQEIPSSDSPFYCESVQIERPVTYVVEGLFDRRGFCEQILPDNTITYVISPSVDIRSYCELVLPDNTIAYDLQG